LEQQVVRLAHGRKIHEGNKHGCIRLLTKDAVIRVRQV